MVLDAALFNTQHYKVRIKVKVEQLRKNECNSPLDLHLAIEKGGARGVMVIVVGNGRGDTSSNSGRDWLHFT